MKRFNHIYSGLKKANSQNSSKSGKSRHLDCWIIMIILTDDVIGEDETFYPGQIFPPSNSNFPSFKIQIFPLEYDSFGYNQWTLKKECMADKLSKLQNEYTINEESTLASEPIQLGSILLLGSGGVTILS